MRRKTLNASRLQAEVSRRLHRLQEVIDDGVKFTVPRPQRQGADRSGCNWTMKHFGNAAGFEAVIADVLARVQAEYNLAAEDEDDARQALGEPPGRPAPGGDAKPFGESERAGEANPFGEHDGARPSKAANPFGDAKPARSGDPFGASGGSSSGSGNGEAPERAPRRPANPFGDD